MYGQYGVSDERATLPELAPRSLRLFAALLDGGLMMVFPLFGALGGFAWGAGTLLESAAAGRAPSSPPEGTTWMALLLFGSLVAMAALVLYQWYGVIVRGQTIGKQLFRVQIVDEAGAPGGFLRALVLRSWVFGLISGVLQVILGGFGLLLWLLDLMPIFGAERRCLHDYLAGTRVRVARGSSLGAVPALALFCAAAIGLGIVAGRAGAPLQSLTKLRDLATRPEVLKGAGGDAILKGLAESPLEVEVPASPGPGPTGDVRLAPPDSSARIYRWEDDSGVVHFTEELESVPQKYRGRARAIE